jgi:hypothetical protein
MWLQSKSKVWLVMQLHTMKTCRRHGSKVPHILTQDHSSSSLQARHDPQDLLYCSTRGPPPTLCLHSSFSYIWLNIIFNFHKQTVSLILHFNILKYLLYANTLPTVSNCLHSADPVLQAQETVKDVEKVGWNKISHSTPRSSHVGFVVDKVAWGRFPPST